MEKRKSIPDFEKHFTQGYLCAVLNLINTHGMGTEARDVLRGCRIDKKDFDLYEIDTNDRETLLKYWDELNY